MSEERALSVVPQHELTRATPEQEIAEASRIATSLDKIIRDKKLFRNISGKDHVFVEGWTAVAALRGVTPREVSNVKQDDGSYVATVELVNAQGRVIGSASAECGGPEETLWQNRRPAARRSMAATRATSKVCRLCFAWIMVLSGYSGTPAEEMETSTEPKAQNAPQGPAKAPNKGSGREWDGNLTLKSGKNKGKKWSELNTGFLDWAIEQNGAISDMAQKELARRATEESTVVEGEVVDREPGSDDELPLDMPEEPKDDPRFM